MPPLDTLLTVPTVMIRQQQLIPVLMKTVTALMMTVTAIRMKMVPRMVRHIMRTLTLMVMVMILILL